MANPNTLTGSKLSTITNEKIKQPQDTNNQNKNNLSGLISLFKSQKVRGNEGEEGRLEKNVDNKDSNKDSQLFKTYLSTENRGVHKDEFKLNNQVHTNSSYFENSRGDGELTFPKEVGYSQTNNNTVQTFKSGCFQSAPLIKGNWSESTDQFLTQSKLILEDLLESIHFPPNKAQPIISASKSDLSGQNDGNEFPMDQPIILKSKNKERSQAFQSKVQNVDGEFRNSAREELELKCIYTNVKALLFNVAKIQLYLAKFLENVELQKSCNAQNPDFITEIKMFLAIDYRAIALKINADDNIIDESNKNNYDNNSLLWAECQKALESAYDLNEYATKIADNPTLASEFHEKYINNFKETINLINKDFTSESITLFTGNSNAKQVDRVISNINKICNQLSHTINVKCLENGKEKFEIFRNQMKEIAKNFLLHDTNLKQK